MKNLILLVTFALVFQFVKGAHHLPAGTVTCHDNHTVDIAITNVDDYREWIASEWKLQNDMACQPIIGDETVTYTNLHLPNCAMSSEQRPESIKYVLKINAEKAAGQNDQGQTRAYNHLYYVSCDYDNQNRSSSSFIPIKNRDDNDSSTAFFTFSLQAFSFPNHTGVLPNTIELNTTMYFKVLVDTQSSAPNLDLHLVKCWGSSDSDSSNSSSSSSNVILIEDGCGNNTVSQDADDTLYYNCTNDDIKETFSLRSYRYLSSAENTPVYIHCDIRVCLADAVNSMCECPSAAACDPSSRKRRSLADNVDENVVYTVSSGPYILEADDEEEGEEAEEEGESDEQDEPQSFSTNLAIILAVSCLVALAMVCGTVYLVARNRNRRRLHGDLNVAT
ncbi:hypothetical protein OS493_037936 [Desmophyllum pertusum]|uniref:ZP domain-containing protein n=1 Tax=Desmophyllum pertusum TaxID=174260 RepID=A0A9X0CCK0_9CNID|nr:hypothetical protein OS493_037936 [Desmophyllum pertusum]